VSDAREAYRRAGVDVAAGEEAVARIRPLAERTFGPAVLGTLGGFAGAIRFDPGRYRDPVLLAGCDGVGTKLAVAEATGRWDGIGQDLVAMCVNDVAAAGGDILFFLDYIACGRLDPDQIERIVASMAHALEGTGAALLGGEMAEMPGMYPAGRVDLAGFAVGACERAELLGPDRVRPGDVLLGLASSGPHANGFSLIRRLVDEHADGLDAELEGVGRLAPALLAPTRVYVRALAALRETGGLHAAAHLTGGGWQGNLPRVLPVGLGARVDLGSWPVPAVFRHLQRWGGLDEHEMLATFNMGVGMVCVVAADAVETARAALERAGEGACVVGEVEEGGAGVRFAAKAS